MPDTSAAGDSWTAAGTALSVFAIGLLTWIGNRMAGKDQAKSPVTPLPEVAGVTMALIDKSVQAEIAKDTERTADLLEDIRDIMREQVEIQADQRERQERDKLRERLDEADEDRREMLRMIRELKDQGARHRPGRPLSDD